MVRKTASELLEDYAERGSEEAFTELVSSHVDLVYSTALRRTSFDAHLAQDITQQVFTDLAQKAKGLPKQTILPGWLHRHTCFRASQAVRTEQRRRIREEKAASMQTPEDGAEAAWNELAPVVDEALTELSRPDRDALVLRFLERRDLKDVGMTLGVGEDAAQKRVSRALERLRLLLGRKGVVTNATTLVASISLHAVVSAPLGLGATAAATALTNVGTAGVTGSLIAKFLAMKNIALGTAAAVAVVVVLTPVALHVAETIRTNHHAKATGLAAPNGSFIHTGMAEEFTVSTKEWAVDFSLAAGKFQIKSRSLQPKGNSANSAIPWDRTADWFAYLPPNQPADGVLLFVFDGHDNAWWARGSALGTSIIGVKQLDDTVPKIVMDRLPTTYKARLANPLQ